MKYKNHDKPAIWDKATEWSSIKFSSYWQLVVINTLNRYLTMKKHWTLTSELVLSNKYSQIGDNIQE